SRVSFQRERKRVSHWKSPWVSVGEASIFPPRSLTTNVLPSSMLVVLPFMLSLPPCPLLVSLPLALNRESLGSWSTVFMGRGAGTAPQDGVALSPEAVPA